MTRQPHDTNEPTPVDDGPSLRERLERWRVLAIFAGACRAHSLDASDDELQTALRRAIVRGDSAENALADVSATATRLRADLSAQTIELVDLQRRLNVTEIERDTARWAFANVCVQRDTLAKIVHDALSPAKAKLAPATLTLAAFVAEAARNRAVSAEEVAAHLGVDEHDLDCILDGSTALEPRAAELLADVLGVCASELLRFAGGTNR